MIETRQAGGGDRNIKKPIEGVGAKKLIGKKLNIKELMELWDQGWLLCIAKGAIRGIKRAMKGRLNLLLVFPERPEDFINMLIDNVEND